MRAMLLRTPADAGERPLEAVEMEDPEPGPGEVRVAVRACAVCRTDLHVVEGDLPEERRPIVPGHQIVGVVDALGPGCDRLEAGERIGIAWLRSTCGGEPLHRLPRARGIRREGRGPGGLGLPDPRRLR